MRPAYAAPPPDMRAGYGGAPQTQYMGQAYPQQVYGAPAPPNQAPPSLPAQAYDGGPPVAPAYNAAAWPSHAGGAHVPAAAAAAATSAAAAVASAVAAPEASRGSERGMHPRLTFGLMRLPLSDFVTSTTTYILAMKILSHSQLAQNYELRGAR